MASRLLVRYASLLSRASSQAPAAAAAAAAAATRILPPAGGHADIQRAQGWPQATRRLMCEGKAVTQEDMLPSIPEQTELETLMDSASKPEHVLMAWEKHRGNGNQAGNALIKWTMLMIKTKAKFTGQPEEIKDSRVVDIMKTIFEEISSVWNSTLVSLLRSFDIMGLPSSDPVLRSVQTEVLWRTRRMNCKQLSHLVIWGAGRKAEQEELMVNAALKQLELRWTELADARILTSLISKGHHLSPTMMDRLEDKALELAEGFTAEQICRVALSLAAQSRRSVPLLRALSYHLLQRPSAELKTPLILDMAFAYGKLNFHHTQVFQRMAAESLPRVPELQPGEVTRFAKSLGFLKWLNIPLFEAFAVHYSMNSENYSVPQICNLIMTFARLNFQPSKGEEFFSKVHAVLEDSLSSLDPFFRTDVLWSLCVLQQAKPHYITSLTQQSHFTKVSGISPSREENYQLKHLHIAATLQLEYPDCTDTSFSLRALPVPTSSSPPTMMQTSLKEALHSLVGGWTDALNTRAETVYGWTIDAEMVVDCDNKPIGMSMLKADHLPNSGGSQALPAGARRLAFLVWEYPNFCSKTKDLLGRFVMMKRHLQLAGLITVEVPYYEWLELKTEWQKSSYLKEKIGKAMAENIAR